MDRWVGLSAGGKAGVAAGNAASSDPIAGAATAFTYVSMSSFSIEALSSSFATRGEVRERNSRKFRSKAGGLTFH